MTFGAEHPISTATTLHSTKVETIGAQLNIKSEDAYQLASQLSELTGKSLTSVVTRALRTELERERRERDIEAKVARMLAAGKEIRAHLREPITSDHSGLYGENGLPL